MTHTAPRAIVTAAFVISTSDMVWWVEIEDADGTTAAERIAFTSGEVADRITDMGARQVGPWSVDEDGRHVAPVVIA